MRCPVAGPVTMPPIGRATSIWASGLQPDSFNGKSRRWAAASIDGYLAGAGTEAIYEQERLTERDRYNEYLMTRLRTAEGLELAAVETRFGKERAERLLRQAEPFMGIGELCFAAGRLAIPAEKFLVSDAVIGALFEADD